MLKKILFCILAAGVLCMSACAPSAAKQEEGRVITGEDMDETGGADTNAHAVDHEDSAYYAHPDYFNMQSNDHLTILSHFATFQQTTETSCSAASALMAIEYLGAKGHTERELCELGRVSTDEDTPGVAFGSANNYYEYGAGVEKICKMLSAIDGIKVTETSYRENWTQDELIGESDGYTPEDVGNLFPVFADTALYSPENKADTELWAENASDSYFVKWLTGHIKAGDCVMVEWGDWDGHWQVLIGYDTMGTPELRDDVVIFADPYDTSDHLQDGYYCFSAERWYTMWKDRRYAAKPFQLRPFVVVAKD